MKIDLIDTTPNYEATDYYLQVLENLHLERRKIIEKELTILQMEASQYLRFDGEYEVIRESFIDSIKEFFKKIFDMFKRKAEDIAKEHNDWLNKNRDKFDNVKYADIELKIFAYWKYDVNAMENACKAIFNTLKNKMKDGDKDINGLIANDSSFNKYKDESGDLYKGLYNLFRTGNSKKLETVTIKGTEVQSKVPDFIKYIEDYLNIVNKMRGLETTMINGINAMGFQTANDTTGSNNGEVTNNSFIPNDSSLMMEAVRIFFEADGDNINQNNNQQNNQQNNAEKEEKKDNGSVKNTNTEDGDKPKVNANGTRNQLATMTKKIMGICLTAVEEREMKYYKVLKDILNASGIKDDKSDEKADNKEDNKKVENNSFIPELFNGRVI